MILSPTDARTKWCPMNRGGWDANRKDTQDPHNCIASDCMHWVWTDAGHTLGTCGLTTAASGTGGFLLGGSGL
jgi:hypothetical protein